MLPGHHKSYYYLSLATIVSLPQLPLPPFTSAMHERLRVRPARRPPCSVDPALHAPARSMECVPLPGGLRPIVAILAITHGEPVSLNLPTTAQSDRGRLVTPSLSLCAGYALLSARSIILTANRTPPPGSHSSHCLTPTRRSGVPVSHLNSHASELQRVPRTPARAKSPRHLLPNAYICPAPPHCSSVTCVPHLKSTL